MLGKLVILAATLTLTSGFGNVELMDLFLKATPRHPQFRTPDVWAPESSQAKYTQNEEYSGAFQPLSECSENKTDLKIGDFGTITTPNYPRNYPARLSCEWQLEGPPGTRIEAVFFDILTQPWFFAYFDYVMVAKDGNFSNVDRMSGDMNTKTPMVITSDKNVMGVRFRSSSLFNFRGFKMQYLVVPEDQNVAAIEPPVFDGICGQPSPTISFTSTSAPKVTESPAPTEGVVDEVTPVGSESSSEFPVIMPGTGAVPAIAPDASEEGKRKFDPEEHIVGGAEALKYSYPWMAALLIDGRHFCGGSLIDDQYIVTAAHCTDKANAITILLGTHNIKANRSVEDGRKIFNITRSHIFQHPEYNGNTITHDISILRLPERVTFTDRIRPVCLPNRYFLPRFFNEEPVKVSGWGKPADNAPGVSPVLKEADVKVLSNEICRTTFRGIVTGNLICIETKREASPCKGDSGGPLMVQRQGPLGSYLMQVGIVSFGSLTCEKGLPVGFTRVTAFLDYINQVTGKNL